MQFKKTFDQLNVFPKGEYCNGCTLNHWGMGASFARTSGTGASGVLLLGEALGASEAEKGEPFVGASGHTLTQMLHLGGWKKDDFLIANVINCQPPDNVLEGAPYEHQAIAHCAPYLEDTIRKNPQIKVIVPMGNVPLHKCLGVKGVKNWHGSVTKHERWQKWIVPTLHPSYILRQGSKEIPTGVFDIGRALSVVQKGWKPAAVDYIEYPTPEVLGRFVDEYLENVARDSQTWLSVDIETPYSADIDEDEREDTDSSYTIIRASLSFRTGQAISFPHADAYKSHFARALSSKGDKVWWNGNKFDIPRLRANGYTLGGMQIDGMDGWHFLYPDLPRGLGYVAPFFLDIEPWKHLANARAEYYSAQDAWAALGITQGVKRELDRLGTWDVFIRDIASITPVFEDMKDVGIGIDEVKRGELRTFYENLRDNSVTLIQEAVPTHLKPVKKKNKAKKEWGYSGKPKDVREYIKANEGTSEEDAWTNCGYEWMRVPDEYRGEDTIAEAEVWRWNKRLDFNPNSPQQIIEYITDKYGEDEVPRNKKNGSPTTGEDELERLAKRKGDRVLELIVDAGKAGTMLSNFINNWPVGADGRVHPDFTNNPATFRLSGKNPNPQNFPHRSKEARLMREMVIPGEGYEWLVEADYTGIEAVLVGWYAKDPAYMTLAKLGVHDFFASHMMALDGKFEPVSLELSEADLALALKEAKKVGSSLRMPDSVISYRDGAKQTIHGSNYREGPLLLHKTYPEVFPTTKVADKLQRFYFETFKSIEPWQESVVDFAYNNHMVRNDFGYIRRFYNVKRWQWDKAKRPKGGWKLVWADDAKKAIATIPQGSAAAIIRRAMLSDAFRELRERRCAMVQIHDSLFCRARDKRERDWVVQQLTQAMVYPIIEMAGLRIPIELKAGRNWGSMEVIGKCF